MVGAPRWVVFLASPFHGSSGNMLLKNCSAFTYCHMPELVSDIHRVLDCTPHAETGDLDNVRTVQVVVRVLQVLHEAIEKKYGNKWGVIVSVDTEAFVAMLDFVIPAVSLSKKRDERFLR